jgi:hypothetical protein
MAGGDGEDEEYLYINLLTNPERYTGYKVGAWDSGLTFPAAQAADGARP